MAIYFLRRLSCANDAEQIEHYTREARRLKALATRREKTGALSESDILRSEATLAEHYIQEYTACLPSNIT